MPYQAVFFDAAGTLFSLREPVGVTYSRIAAAQGVEAPPARLEAAFRAAWKRLPAPLHPESTPPVDDDRVWWRELVAQTFAETLGAPLQESKFEALFDLLYQHFALPHAWQLYPDVEPALRELRTHYRLLVVSNFDRRLHPILQGLGIAKYFEAVILSSEVGASKPHPRIFAAALRAADLPPKDCLHVGDDPRADDEGARQSHIASCLLDRPRFTLANLAENLQIFTSGHIPSCQPP